MTQTNLFDDYVKRRLDAWGREFALHRDAEILGHRSKNMLQILIEHKGEMPGRVTGYRPLTIPPAEMQIEDLVRDLAMDDMRLANVLRAYYCGAGRQAHERREIAEQLAGVAISKQRYFAMHDMGFQRVAGMLSAIARIGAFGA